MTDMTSQTDGIGQTETRPEFTDADLTHRWAIEHRIPVVTSTPSWFYEAALVVPSHPEGEAYPEDTWNLYDALWPTDAEAAIVGSYIDYRMGYYNDGWAAKMRRRALDVDSSTNTVVVMKTDDGWRYTKRSFSPQIFYPRENTFSPDRDGLVALLTAQHSDHRGQVQERFAQWLIDHAEVWGR